MTFGADRPLVVAHRGASVEQPENTIEAFEAAIDAGADAVEFDVRLTRDVVPVVMHDPDVSRTTDGHGLVSSMTGDEIRMLGVPTLEEALACLAGRAGADIELKNEWDEPGYVEAGAPALEATFGELNRVAFTGPVLLSSFDPATVRRSRDLRPDVPTGLLTRAEVDAATALDEAAGDDHPWVLPFIAQVLSAGAGFVDEVHDAGLLLGVWIADDPGMARTLFEWGVDAVATNDPRSIVRVRDSSSTKKRFLVAHDYGTGGVWASLLARSTKEIRARYPSLAIIDERPAWLDDQKLQKIEERMTVDIDDADHPFLRAATAEP